MELINKQYIVDENNRKVAVQIPIDVFEKMELLLEDHALFHLMKENQDFMEGILDALEDFSVPNLNDGEEEEKEED